MKQLNWNDIKDCEDLSKKQKSALTELLSNPYSRYVLLKRESSHEYFETQSWTEELVKDLLMGYGLYPIDKIAIEIFHKGVANHIKKGYKSSDLITDIFDDMDKYTEDYQQLTCTIKSRTKKASLMVKILTEENTFDFDVTQAAKEYFVKQYKIIGFDYEYSDLTVNIHYI